MSNEEEKEEEDVGADAGLSEPGVPGVPGVPWHPKILAHQLTLSQLNGLNYAQHITRGQIILRKFWKFSPEPKIWMKIFLYFRPRSLKWAKSKKEGNLLY